MWYLETKTRFYKGLSVLLFEALLIENVFIMGVLFVLGIFHDGEKKITEKT